VRLDLFVRFKYESNTIILFASIRYSMRDLLSDLNTMSDPQTSDMRQIRVKVKNYSHFYYKYLNTI